jgi:uncharacterized protein YeaO (DUF488 family)
VAARRRRTLPGSHHGYSSPACYLHEFESPPAAGIIVKRIYAAAEAADGFRVLVDRLWPRGISKRRAALDLWAMELAPSAALRQWFHADPSRWTQFVRRYRAELRAQAAALQALRQRAAQQRVTLLYAARDAERNHALVLRDLLKKT